MVLSISSSSQYTTHVSTNAFDINTLAGWRSTYCSAPIIKNHKGIAQNSPICILTVHDTAPINTVMKITAATWCQRRSGMPMPFLLLLLTGASMVTGYDGNWRTDVLSEPFLLLNESAITLLVDPSTRAVALWVCMPEQVHTERCSGFDDAPRMPKGSMTKCIYITQACECIRWFVDSVTSNRAGWTVSDQEGGCARLEYQGSLPMGQAGPVAELHSIRLRWTMDTAGMVPSNTAVQWAFDHPTTGDDMLDLACAYSARLTGALQRTVTAWGCEYTLLFGLRIYVRKT